MDERKRLTQLYTDHWRKLFGYALRRCASRADAAEIVSEVFLVAWRRISTVPDGDQATLWLYGVAHHAIHNQLRTARRRARTDAALHSTLLLAHAPDPADLTPDSYQHRVVRTAMTRLSLSDQELLRLIAWEELTPAEAAAVLGLTPGTARARLSRARRRLAALIDEHTTSQPEPAFEN